MPFARAPFHLTALLVLNLAAVVSANEIGHEVADQVSLTSYQHYLDDLLYTHDGDNRNSGTPDHVGARANIVATFESFGLQVEDQPFASGSSTGHNIVATQLGTLYPDSYFVIGAHYDSVSNPGADDNASGVAGVMETARVLSAYQCEYTIKYIAFDMEEDGLVGSDAYVGAHFYDDIRGMISMDMIAYKGSGYGCILGADYSGSYPFRLALKTAVLEYGNGLVPTLTGGGGSDQYPFESAGYPACLLIEKNYQANPCYHQGCDSVDTAGYIDYAYAVSMTRSVAGCLVDNAFVVYHIDCQTGAGCELGTYGDEDCNSNGVWDYCDIRCGTSADVNANGIPDECEPHETWYVNAANCPGPGSGTQDDPFCLIQDAINAASNNPSMVVEVIVTDGTYTGTGNKNLDFAGKAITVRSAGGAANCTIDCQGSGRGFSFHTQETAAARVDGFTIRGASTSGIYCQNSRPKIVNCIITANAASSGGGVFCSGASPTLNNCKVHGNTASSNGGAVFCITSSSSYSSNPTLTNCVISENTATAAGGGVYCTTSSSSYFSSPMLTNCTISDNRGSSGGGVYCNGGTTSLGLTDCIISTNTATSGGGGGVCCNYSSLTLTGCTISGNLALGSSSSYGGGVYCNYSNAKLTRCVIKRNMARGSSLSSGGGMYCSSSSSPTLANCTISENAALTGGGMYCTSSSSRPKLTNCTISTNTASTGGGVYCTSSSNPYLTNCILWGDTPQEIYVASGTPVVNYCDVQGGYTGTGNINVDPGLAFADDFHLMSGSPCIDAGSNAPTGGLPSSDLEGNPRRLDGNGDGQAIADMGAYEFDPAGPTIALSPPTFEVFSYVGDPEPIARTVAIRGNNDLALTWEVASDCPWLSAVPVGGSCQQEVDSISLLFNTTGLIVGDHSCLLTVSAPQATNSPRHIPITLHLGAARRVPSGYSTIQAAIDAATKYDWVLLADGAYSGIGNKDLDFHGKAITLRSESGNPAACIIDCEGSGRGFYFHSGEWSNSRVQGFTIRGASSGAVSCSNSSSPALSDCIISGNTAPGVSGGGVYCYSYSSPTLSNCTISGNTASTGSGVYCSSYSSPTLANCTISGNVAGNQGGGVDCSANSSPALSNCTITGNSAAALSGGLYCSSSSPQVTNSILWGNTPQEIYVSGGTPVVTYSDVQGSWTGTGNLNADPLFVDAANGDFHLASNSPCIDAGNPASDFSLEPEPDGGRINMGAYGNTPEAECKAWLRLEGYGLVSQTRVGRTVFDYQINVRLKNASMTGVINVVAELLSVPANITIIDNQVNVGAIPAGATVTSTDTFTIRVDRTVPISALPISWRVSYSKSGHTEQRVLAGSLGFDTQPAPHPVPIEPAAVPAETPAIATPAPHPHGE